MKTTDINWTAIDRVRKYYRDQHESWNPMDYQDWMLENYGITHTYKSIEITDESKYSLFLLRFA